MNTIKFVKCMESDLHFISEWRSDPKINQFLRSGNRTLDEVRKWYEVYYSGEENLIYLIIFDGNPIGYFVIEGIDKVNRNCEFGIVIGKPEYHNKGIGTSAIELMLDKAFNEMKMHRVFAGIEGDNSASVKCFTKAGFILEGRLREVKVSGDGYRDILLLSVLEQEWCAENVKKIF